MENKRIHDYFSEIKDFYIIFEDGTIYSEKSCKKLKTRCKPGTEYQSKTRF